jgi:hypothetical protein
MKSDVDKEQTVDETGDLIDGAENDGKDDVEEMQPTSGTAGPGQKEK